MKYAKYMMRGGRKYTVMLIAALSIGAILSWPVRQVAVVLEPDVDLHQVVTVSASGIFEQDIIVQGGALSGVAIWLSPHESVAQPGTSLSLQIRDAVTDEVLRSAVQSVPVMSTPRHENVQFNFWPLRQAAERKLKLSLRSGDTISVARVHPDMATSKAIIIAVQQYKTLTLTHGLWNALTSYDTNGEDVYHHWRRGQQVLEGVNPYTCILDRTCENDKFAVHLPLFYELSALSQAFGLREYESWIAWWRPFFWLCYVSIGGILFTTVWRKKQPLLALFGLFFWLGNRWSLYVLRVAHIDFFALLWLVMAVVVWWQVTPGRRVRPVVASFLLGVSLSIKHVAAPLSPIYVIYAWRTTEGEPWRARVWYLLLHVLALGAVPLLSVLPFAWEQPQAVLQGLLFSVVRDSEANFGAPSLVAILNWGSLGSAAVTFLVWGIIYVAAWRRAFSPAAAALVTIVIFLAFNQVIFNQYFVWLMPLIPLVLAQTRERLVSETI